MVKSTKRDSDREEREEFIHASRIVLCVYLEHQYRLRINVEAQTFQTL